MEISLRHLPYANLRKQDEIFLLPSTLLTFVKARLVTFFLCKFVKARLMTFFITHVWVSTNDKRNFLPYFALKKDDDILSYGKLCKQEKLHSFLHNRA